MKATENSKKDIIFSKLNFWNNLIFVIKKILPNKISVWEGYSPKRGHSLYIPGIVGESAWTIFMPPKEIIIVKYRKKNEKVDKKMAMVLKKKELERIKAARAKLNA